MEDVTVFCVGDVISFCVDITSGVGDVTFFCVSGCETTDNGLETFTDFDSG